MFYPLPTSKIYSLCPCLPYPNRRELIFIFSRSLPEGLRPIHASEKVEIGRRPKQVDHHHHFPQNIDGDINGISNGNSNGTLGKRKRPVPTDANNNNGEEEDDDIILEEGEARQVKKRGRVPEQPQLQPSASIRSSLTTSTTVTMENSTILEGGNDLIVLDGDEKDHSGAITIDDDD